MHSQVDTHILTHRGEGFPKPAQLGNVGSRLKPKFESVGEYAVPAPWEPPPPLTLLLTIPLPAPTELESEPEVLI